MKRLKNNLKSIGGVFTLLLLQLNTFGQDVAADATKPETIQIPEVLFDPITYLWILLGSIVLLTIYTMSHTIKALSKVIEGRVANVPEESEEAVGMQAAIKTSLYKRIMHSLVKAVPIEKEKDVMLDHNYDGIQELDNQLPPWWKYGFYLTIVFAFVYLINFHVSGSGKLQLAEYNEEMKNAELATKKRMENSTNNINAASVTILTEAGSLASGKEIYVKNCVACHGDLGQGNVGPNLTDEFWIHGGGIKNIFNTIVVGVPSKGMISWKSQLTPKATQEVASYILTLQGTNPAGAKEAQGEKWVEVVDSTTI
ncbi:MAG: c-type cytochrome, partial [Bacteroidia bacterium]|nr:c-type cytochrome [Bacteroidia bacterium]